MGVWGPSQRSSMSWLAEFAAALPDSLPLASLMETQERDLWQTDPQLAAAYALAASDKFDAEDYLCRYPDVAQVGVDPVLHFCRHGISEGRTFRLKYRSGSFGPCLAPKVSLILPVYNNSQYLRECFDSAVGQTLADIEILIVDDGSTDAEAIAIMDEYAARDARIRLIRKPNTGYGNSMNVGIDAARGKYMGILESDDYILPEMCEYYYKIAEKHKLDFVKSDFRRFFGSQRHRLFEDVELLPVDYWYDRVLDTSTDDEMREYIPKFLVIWNGLYNLEFIRENKIRFNESPGASFQDNGFFFQTFMHARKCMTTRRPMYMLRRDNAGSSIYGTEKVNVMRDEYQFIYKKLAAQDQLYKRYIKAFHYLRFTSYIFNLWRVKAQYRDAALEGYCGEYRYALERGELDPGLFQDKYDIACQVAAGTFSWQAWGKVELSVILYPGLSPEKIRNVLRRIQAQEIKDIEILCMENGRDPETYALLRAEARQDERIKVFYNAAEAWIKDVVKNAKGEYILFWDAEARPHWKFFGDLLWIGKNLGSDAVIDYDPGISLPWQEKYGMRDMGSEQLKLFQGNYMALYLKKYLEALPDEEFANVQMGGICKLALAALGREKLSFYRDGQR